MSKNISQFPKKRAIALATAFTALTVGSVGVTHSKPASAVDQTKVPHYFGPFPNWANSPFVKAEATVSFVDTDTTDGIGSGAAATATVGLDGTITSLTLTSPGKGYTVGATTVDIVGAGTGATATATVSDTGSVTALTILPGNGGTGYSAPIVEFVGGGSGTGALATAYGSVEGFDLAAPEPGFTAPMVDIDLPDGPNGTPARGHAAVDASGNVTGIVIDVPGSGYTYSPTVVLRDGTIQEPTPNGHVLMPFIATATLSIQSISIDAAGTGFTSVPTVNIVDPNGTGAIVTAEVNAGAITTLTLDTPGKDYFAGGGIEKFVDALPGLCNPAVANSCPTDPAAKYIPLAVPEAKSYTNNGVAVAADQYEIGLVQYRTKFHRDLPATLSRGYVQLETAANASISQHVPLFNEMLDGTKVPVMVNGVQALGVTPPQWLGPTIAATKNKPVRIVFRNLLPTGSGGDLFLPTDSGLMGAGEGGQTDTDTRVDSNSTMDDVRNPMCNESPKPDACLADNRATLHLHGGLSPWISDGTPHQWITPAGETTEWPQGVSVKGVPDMAAENCDGDRDGCMTFYYTNQQSARLMFYHDHALGTTRLNVYAGEAAGYLISDDTEKALINAGTIPGPADTIPLIVQDRTFVPKDAQLAEQDPTWDKARWGGEGSFWYHHVYMPAQNPGDPGGMSAYGRWMYGPWFWPPADAAKGPIPNPYYNKDPATNFTTDLATPCNLDDSTTWQYPIEPFCEPPLIPGTPNISVGMEQFNDTPTVNGTAYPTVTLEPKAYRLRMLNAANDRFMNFQWYLADDTTASTRLNVAGQAIGGTEVALNPTEVADAQLDPVVFPTPVLKNNNTAGPDWIQIGSEGGFLPAPAVIDGQQPTTWITDPTRFDVGNVDLHSLVLAPAERADVIVDFSQFAGKTLILYNDAPAAYPARVPSYDYYTGAPDLRPVGAPAILPGYGPNTRTVMQVKIADNVTGGTGGAPAFNLANLQKAFKHNALGTGVFEAGQPPIIVGQSTYNTAYGSTFAASGDCNNGGASTTCDGMVRIGNIGSFGFNTLKSPAAKTVLAMEPKAIHDEMNSTNFDEYGRMQATLGMEAPNPSPLLQNVTLYPYPNPVTEIIDGTNLPRNVVTYDANGLPAGEAKITPIASNADGTQIWRITHNGVDTHPIHFHLFDVQVLNRVTWDNIIIPPDANELGWKDTVRMSPLEDTIVAVRPILPELPFELPNSIRPMNPELVTGAMKGFNSIDPAGIPTAPIVNDLVNFGWEYVYHCHILSHEEMDMMRPVSAVLPPNKPTTLTYASAGNSLTLNWNDNSIAETAYLVQKSTDGGATWTNAGTDPSPLAVANTAGPRSITDAAYDPTVAHKYRVVAQNTVGYGFGFPTTTASSVSDILDVAAVAGIPAAPSNLTATLGGLPGTLPRVLLSWLDNSTTETGFELQRHNGITNANCNAALGWTSLNQPADTTAATDGTVGANAGYCYRIRAVNATGASDWVRATVSVPARPATPTWPIIDGATTNSLTVNFTVPATAIGYEILRGATTIASVAGNGPVVFVDNGVSPGTLYTYRVRIASAGGWSNWSSTTGTNGDGYTVPVANADAPVATANTSAAQTISAATMGVGLNDGAQAAGRSYALVAGSFNYANGGAGATPNCTNAGCTVVLAGVGANGGARQISKRGTYTFSYTLTVGGQTSAPATVTLTVN